MERTPFDRKEIENATEIPSTFPGFPPSKRFDYPISPKENYRLLYQRKVPVWLPSSVDGQTMTPRIDPDNLARVFSFEAQPMTDEDRTGGPDKFGIPWVYVPQVGGSMVEPGNPTLLDANDWQDVINFPDVASWDWDASAKANKAWVDTDKWLTYTHLTGFFERLISFMDFEGAAMALVDDEQKDAVHSLFDALTDCYIDIFSRAYNAYGFDTLNFHDDWGAQRAPFFSLDLVMEMIVPHLKKVVDFCHNELGTYFDMHSCGKNELLVPAYIAAGCDSWRGQDMNDKAKLHDQYGDKLIVSIEPVTPTNKYAEASLAEANTFMQQYLDKYIPGFKEKPFFMGGFTGPQGWNDFVYEETRKRFYEMATN